MNVYGLMIRLLILKCNYFLERNNTTVTDISKSYSFKIAVMVAANKAKEILITVVSLLSSLQTPIDKEHTTPNGVVEVDAIVEGQIKSLHE